MQYATLVPATLQGASMSQSLGWRCQRLQDYCVHANTPDHGERVRLCADSVKTELRPQLARVYGDCGCTQAHNLVKSSSLLTKVMERSGKDCRAQYINRQVHNCSFLDPSTSDLLPIVNATSCAVSINTLTIYCYHLRLFGTCLMSFLHAQSCPNPSGKTCSCIGL